MHNVHRSINDLYDQLQMSFDSTMSKIKFIECKSDLHLEYLKYKNDCKVINIYFIIIIILFTIHWRA